MELPAKPETISEVRSATEEFARSQGISEQGLADLKTVVSEACSNVVRYAYEDLEPGTLEVELDVVGENLRLRVRDHGCGIAPKPDADHPTLHMGLPLIGALSNRFVLSSERGTGTELEIHVPLRASRLGPGLLQA